MALLFFIYFGYFLTILPDNSRYTIVNVGFGLGLGSMLFWVRFLLREYRRQQHWTAPAAAK